MPTLRLTMTALALIAVLADPLDRAIAAVYPLGDPPRSIAYLLDAALPRLTPSGEIALPRPDDFHGMPYATSSPTFATAAITGAAPQPRMRAIPGPRTSRTLPG